MDRLTEKPFRIDSEYCYENALIESDCKFYRFVSEVEDFLEKYNFDLAYYLRFNDSILWKWCWNEGKIG